MRLTRAPGPQPSFPDGRTDVSVFSAVPCVLPAPDALRAFPRRTFPSVSPGSLARRGRFFHQGAGTPGRPDPGKSAPALPAPSPKHIPTETTAGVTA
jgi:hypothetical protein